MKRFYRKYVCIEGHDKDFPGSKHTLYRSLPTEDRVPKVGELWNNWLKVERVLRLTKAEFFKMETANCLNPRVIV